MRSTNVLARTAMAGLALLGLSATAAAQGRVEKAAMVRWFDEHLRRGSSSSNK